MSAEETLILALTKGERPAKNIPLHDSTRRKAAVRLESRGLLYRKRHGKHGSLYGLTRDGKRYAIDEGLISFPRGGGAVSMDLDSATMLALASQPIRPTPPRKKMPFRIFIVLYVLTCIGACLSVLFIMHVTGYLR